MAYRKERSSSFSRERLHSFTFLDNGLKWGAHRSFRRSFDQHRSSSAPVTDQSREVENELTHQAQNQEFEGSPVKNSGHRKDSMVGLQRGCEGMRISMVEERGKGKGKVSEDDCNENRAGGGSRSWNLRTRRSACKAPRGNGGDEMMTMNVRGVPVGGNGVGSERGGNYEGFSPVRRIDSRLRSAGGMGIAVEQKTERPKFEFALTKEEIEEDFLIMTGAKPPRKPKRRPKAVQKKLNDLVPGLWLQEATPETYEVDEKPKRKGLK